MDTVSALLALLHLSQACLSAYTIYLSSIVVPKLQRYEEKAEKAAEYSNLVEDQLHQTRTTQTSGALTVGWQIHFCPALKYSGSRPHFPQSSQGIHLKDVASILLSNGPIISQLCLVEQTAFHISNLVFIRVHSRF